VVQIGSTRIVAALDQCHLRSKPHLFAIPTPRQSEASPSSQSVNTSQQGALLASWLVNGTIVTLFSSDDLQCCMQLALDAPHRQGPLLILQGIQHRPFLCSSLLTCPASPGSWLGDQIPHSSLCDASVASISRSSATVFAAIISTMYYSGIKFWLLCGSIAGVVAHGSGSSVRASRSEINIRFGAATQEFHQSLNTKLVKRQTCGPDVGACPSGQCCSGAGYCGTTEPYCMGPQCQIDYSGLSCDAR